jgi:hypothetical protein
MTYRPCYSMLRAFHQPFAGLVTDSMWHADIVMSTKQMEFTSTAEFFQLRGCGFFILNHPISDQ